MYMIRHRGTPPGSMGLPLGLGETISYMFGGVAPFVRARVQKHGPIFKTHVLFSPTVFVTGEEDVKWFYKEMREVGWPETWNRLMGKTLTTVNGAQHKFQRTLVGRAFTNEALGEYLPNIEQFTEEHLQKCVELSEAGAFDPATEIKRYTYNVVERVAVGERGIIASESMGWFATWLKGFEALTSLNLPFTAFGQAMRARRRLQADYQRILTEKRHAQQENAVGKVLGKDILSNVLHAESEGKRLTDQEILDFLIVLMFAGHDTTLATIQSMMFFLGKRPELRSELEAEVAGLWDGRSPLTYEMCTSSAPKCRQFIEETLRVLPPITALFRTCPRDLVHRGHRIPKGWKVGIAIVHNHFDGEVPGLDAATLDPTIQHDSLPAHRNTPFGLGARLCIGYRLAKLEMTVWLMHFLARYELRLHDSSLSVFPFYHAKVKVSMSSKS